MTTTEPSAKIKQLRTLLGYSQMELAQNTGLSLRTIQRIESGETKPHGDTLQRLSQALNTSPAELVELPGQMDKPFLIMLNLSALSFIVFPLLGVLVPLILWMIQRHKVKHADEAGKALLNLQITCCLLVFILYVATITTKIMHVGFRLPVTNVNSMDLLFIAAGLVYLLNMLYVIVNSVRAAYGKPVKYNIAIPFLR